MKKKSKVHLGHWKAFDGWKLIETKSDGSVMLHPISKKVAEALRASGMNEEG